MFWSLLPVLFLFGATSAVTTTFHFNGTVSCNRTGQFAYQIIVIEDDFPLLQDTLLISNFSVRQSSPSPYSLIATDTGDGPLDPNYEIYYLVYHDCCLNTHSRVYKFFYLGSIPVVDGDVNHTYNFDVTEKGCP